MKITLATLAVVVFTTTAAIIICTIAAAHECQASGGVPLQQFDGGIYCHRSMK